MRSILRLISYATAHAPAQTALRACSRAANYLRGMGSGAGVNSSGESGVFRLLSPRCVLFDVGANRGDYAHAAITAIPSADLHCFEPSKKAFTILSSRMQGTRTTLNNIGLGEQDSSKTLFSPSDGSELASLSKRNLDHFGINMNHEQTVKIKTLDDYCSERNIGKIDLLKIDVEGHEMSVLKGGMRMLTQRSIKMIVFEFGGGNIDSRTFFQDFYYLFQRSDANSISRIIPSGHLVPVNQYTEDLEYFQTTNYLVQF